MRIALTREVERLEAKPSLLERLRPTQDSLEAYPRSRLAADKAFHDSLYEDP